MKLVEQLTDIKVPKVLWEEASIDVLGVPFFVMERVQGKVPPDIPPYVFGGWLFDATPESQLQLQELCVGIIAQLHQIKQNLQILTSWNSILKAILLWKDTLLIRKSIITG